MQPSRILSCLAVVLSITWCESLNAEDAVARQPQHVTSERLQDAVCPVHPDQRARRENATNYKDAWLYFSSPEAMQSFDAGKEKQEAFANYQLVLTKQYRQQNCPLSGEEPDEDFGTMMVGKVQLLVLCEDCAKEIGKLPLEEQVTTVFDAQGFELAKFTRGKLDEDPKP
ncbi:MAG: hypothetical protein AAF670_19120 [Planctomycetota bacterium]